MAVTTNLTNKPLNPRGQDQSPKGYNRAELYTGKALDFDGVNDYVDVPYLDSLANTGVSSSFSFYFNADALTGNMVFAEQRKDASNRYVVWYDHSNPQIQLYMNSSSYSVNFPLTETGRWFYFTGVVDGSTAKMYINGDLIGSTSYVPFESNVDFYLGTYNSASGFFYNGKMSNAKIFNTALTAAQVADLYNNPEKIVPTGVSNDALKLWLPMQEGAGTTAYDGSGNGNHGTISGATYTHGIGAPVSQTAVISWNKGSNLISDSEDFSQWSNASQFVTYTTDDTTAPDGQTTADKITEDTSSNHHRFYKQIVFGTEGGSNQSYTISGFVKYIDRQYISIGLSDNSAYNGLVNFDLINGTIGGEYTYNGSTFSNKTITDFGNDWWKFSVTITSPTWAGGSIYAIAYLQESSSVSTGAYLGESKSVHVWGWNVAKENYTMSYIPTFGTAQTSEVLLPAGLTTGRDITGVNLFENVRKQGALNLDGKSWAEVHDNASLDISPAMTMECWVDFSKIDSTAFRHFIVKPSGAVWNTPYARYALRASNAEVQWWFESAGYLENHLVSLTGWNHFAVTKDGTAEKLYINGSQVDSNVGNATITASDYDLLLGEATQGVERLDSQIAQPRIYNRALTAEEVARNYNAGKNTYTND